MIEFTNPCFVCVVDAEKRKELMAWLHQIGYKVFDWYWGKYIRVIRCWTTPKGISKAVGYPCKQVRKTDVDCGENIQLFKALAAMNDDNDLEQWFLLDGAEDLFFCKLENIQGYNLLVKYRKATVEEIIKFLSQGGD